MEVELDQSDKKNVKNRVKVAIRVRPMIARELVTHERTCVDYLSKQEIVIGGDRQYKFDRVFRESSTQEEVYEESVRELIMGCFEGYNAAVLAYGQTGSIFHCYFRWENIHNGNQYNHYGLQRRRHDPEGHQRDLHGNR